MFANIEHVTIIMKRVQVLERTKRSPCLLILCPPRPCITLNLKHMNTNRLKYKRHTMEQQRSTQAKLPWVELSLCLASTANDQPRRRHLHGHSSDDFLAYDHTRLRTAFARHQDSQWLVASKVHTLLRGLRRQERTCGSKTEMRVKPSSGRWCSIVAQET